MSEGCATRRRPPTADGLRLDQTLLAGDLYPRTVTVREADLAVAGDRVEYGGAQGTVRLLNGPVAVVEFDAPVFPRNVAGPAEAQKVVRINRERLRVLGRRRRMIDGDNPLEGLKNHAVQTAHELHQRLVAQQRIRDEYTLACRVAIQLGAQDDELPGALSGRRRRPRTLNLSPEGLATLRRTAAHARAVKAEKKALERGESAGDGSTEDSAAGA